MAIQDVKFDGLLAYLNKLGHVAVAFSGGVDSTFLLASARMALGKNVKAIIVDSPALARHELDEARQLAQTIGVDLIELKEEGIEEEIKYNPLNRCYFCKKVEYGSIKEEAARHGIKYVLDGSNKDDLKDVRPGMKARDELMVLSPLQELGFTKEEIRSFSKELGLATWDKQAAACLFSRIPYGQEIKPEDLVKIEKAEKFLLDKGFRTVRVRCHNDLARIEVAPEDRDKLLADPLSTEVSKNLKSFGFRFVTIDLQGYRMGSFN